jgi:hypothetical protein
MATGMRGILRGTVLFLALGSGGCTNPTAVQVLVHNEPDNFQFNATAVSKANDPRSYSWPNSGTQATVTLSTMSSGGGGRIVIRDAANAVVFDTALQPDLSQLTEVGAAGVWHISITFTDFIGTLELFVVKL